MSEEQKSEWYKCNYCKSVMVKFNPPLEFEADEICQPCEKMHPEIGVKCHLYDCHDGEHTHFMKDPITWKD